MKRYAHGAFIVIVATSLVSGCDRRNPAPAPEDAFTATGRYIEDFV